MKRSNKKDGTERSGKHAHERRTRNGVMVLAGAELYDALYATGYHANGNTSRAHELIEYLTTTNVSIVHGVTSVLDVGCSHGFAVEKLWSAGFVASGVDISSLAVAKAREFRGEPKDRCRTPCFAVGNASALPWERNAFDAIMSSDVLEHGHTMVSQLKDAAHRDSLSGWLDRGQGTSRPRWTVVAGRRGRRSGEEAEPEEQR